MSSLMDEFFATNSYNEEDDWRTDPLTDEDPDDDASSPGEKNFREDQPRDDHGRWSDTGGGEGSDAVSYGYDLLRGTEIGHGTARDLADYEVMKDDARSELKKLDMLDQRLEFRYGEGKKIAALEGIRDSTTAAHFLPLERTGGRGSVQLNLDAIEPEYVRGVVRHEAFHARFHYALQKSVKVGNFLEENTVALHREDGTTAYSKAWWQRYQGLDEPTTPTNRSAFKRAVNESLAEMHKRRSLTPTYQKLNTLVDGIWAKRKR